MKPKIAVCLSGEVRDYHHCYESLFSFLRDYDYDIFLSIWDVIGGNGSHFVNQKINLDQIIKAYDPKSVNVVSKRGWYLGNCDLSKISTHATWMPMFYMWLRCNLLMKKYAAKYNVHYDYVMITRPDLLFLNSCRLDVSKLNPIRVFCGQGYIQGRIPVRYWRRKFDIRLARDQYNRHCQLLNQGSVIKLDASILDDFDLADFKEHMNFNSVINITKSPNHIITAPNDQLMISTAENIEIVCNTFTNFLLFMGAHVEDEFILLHGNPVMNILAYQVWINKLHFQIMSYPYSVYKKYVR